MSEELCGFGCGKPWNAPNHDCVGAYHEGNGPEPSQATEQQRLEGLWRAAQAGIDRAWAEIPFASESDQTLDEEVRDLVADRDRLAEALDRLEGGPDTLTPDGAKVLHDYGELRARLALSQHSDPEGGTDG